MKIGLCGLGKRLANVIRVFDQLIPELELVAYADPSPIGLDYLLERDINPGKAYNDLETMLNNETLDLLMIGSPNHMHLEQIHLGLNKGLKIFTEKPVVISDSQTFELLRLLKEYGTDQVMVGLVLRYSPLYRDLQNTVASGRLGDIISIEASEHLSPSHGAFFQKDWRRLQEFAGPFMLEKCCHDLDLYQGVVNQRPMRVASFGGRKMFVPEHASLESEKIYRHWEPGWSGVDSTFTSDADIVDHQTAIVEYEGGANLCFHTNLNVPDEFRRFCVIGTKGMAEGDFIRGFYRVHDAVTSEQIERKTYEHSDADQHYGAEDIMARDFRAHFVDKAPLPVSVLDALEAGVTALKIEEARKTKQVIHLKPFWDQFDSYGLR